MLKTILATIAAIAASSIALPSMAQCAGSGDLTTNPDGSTTCGDEQTVDGSDIEVLDDPLFSISYDADTDVVSVTERQIQADGGYIPPPGMPGNGVWEPSFYGYAQGQMWVWQAAQWVLGSGGSTATVYSGINSIPPKNAALKSIAGKLGILGVPGAAIASAGAGAWRDVLEKEKADCLAAQAAAKRTMTVTDDISSCPD